MPVGYLLRKQRDAHINEYSFVTGRMCAKYIKYLFQRGFCFVQFNKVQAMHVFGC